MSHLVLQIRRVVSVHNFHLLAVGVSLIFFILGYHFLIIPTIYAGDQADTQVTPPTFGIMHPPGYSVLVLAGGLFWNLTRGWLFSDPAHCMNVFNLLSGTMLLYTWIILAARLCASRFWAIAVPLFIWIPRNNIELIIMPEVYTFYSLLFFLAVFYFFKLRERPSLFCLFLATILYGMYTSARLYAVVILPFLLLYVLFIPEQRFRIKRPVRFFIFMAFFLTPFLFCWFHIRLLAPKPFPTNYLWFYGPFIETPQGIVWEKLGRWNYLTYWLISGKLFHYLFQPSLKHFWQGLQSHYNLFLFGGTLIPLIIVLGGFILIGFRRLRRQRFSALILATAIVWEFVFFTFYRPADYRTMLMPFCGLCGLVLTVGLSQSTKYLLGRGRKGSLRFLKRWFLPILAAMILLPVIVLNAKPQDEIDFSLRCLETGHLMFYPLDIHKIQPSINASFKKLPPNSVLLLDWMWSNTAIYAALFRYSRQDVLIHNKLSPDTALDLIAQYYPSRPVFYKPSVQEEELHAIVRKHYIVRQEGILFYIAGGKVNENQ